MTDDFYVDPTQPDPRFPNRPTHPDFVVLSMAAQWLDLRAGAGASIPDITGVDDESLRYAIEQRLGTLSAVTRGAIKVNELTMALYVDAFSLGKMYAEAPR